MSSMDLKKSGDVGGPCLVRGLLGWVVLALVIHSWLFWGEKKDSFICKVFLLKKIISTFWHKHQSAINFGLSVCKYWERRD